MPQKSSKPENDLNQKAESENLAGKYDAIKSMMGDAIKLLQSHPQIQPPIKHPTIYFVTDFIINTYNQLLSINVDKLVSNDSEEKAKMTEVMGRNQFAGMLIDENDGVDHDTPNTTSAQSGGSGGESARSKETKGDAKESKGRAILAMMTGVNPNDPTMMVKFGPEIRAKIDALTEI